MEPEDPILRELSRDHAASLDVLRRARSVFFWLAVVAVGFHIGAWIIIGYTDVLSPLAPAVLLAGSDFRDDLAPPTEGQLVEARRWEHAVRSALSLGGFVSRVSVLVLTGLFTIALLVCLTARIGGAADLTGACVWSLVALAMLVPWLQAPGQAIGVASALGTLNELNSVVDPPAGNTGGFLPFVRFVICPVLVMVCLVLAQLCFRAALRRISVAPGAKLPIHEV